MSCEITQTVTAIPSVWELIGLTLAGMSLSCLGIAVGIVIAIV